MGIMVAITNKKIAKIKAIGKATNLLILLVAISECMIKKISKEKGVSLQVAEDLVIDCIKNGTKTIKEES